MPTEFCSGNATMICMIIIFLWRVGLITMVAAEENCPNYDLKKDKVIKWRAKVKVASHVMQMILSHM